MAGEMVSISFGKKKLKDMVKAKSTIGIFKKKKIECI